MLPPPPANHQYNNDQRSVAISEIYTGPTQETLQIDNRSNQDDRSHAASSMMGGRNEQAQLRTRNPQNR
jgi:hypothetical protein